MSVASQVEDVQRLTKAAKDSTARGHYADALDAYTEIVKRYPDLAITEYARLGRALLLFEVGERGEGLLELQDERVVLQGYPEVHAALAAALYVERPDEISRAESEWETATAYDSRYADVAWVRANKAWPPSMLKALERFLTLG
mmetsp:Transcript_15901/g.49980  ORF Transcript_15901/g.49980 Transcript_15901/m.49980 type:complete len:144 (-) Transcript_15901:122-553(-)